MSSANKLLRQGALAAVFVFGSIAVTENAFAGDSCRNSNCWQSDHDQQSDDEWYLHHSTPQERAETRQLNRDYLNAAAAQPLPTNDDADYRDRERQYQWQLDRYRAARQDYHHEMAEYAHLSERYRAEREAYQRDAWPRRDWWLRDSEADISNWAVLTVGGNIPVGFVSAVARSQTGRLEAIRVALCGGGVVWIDASDLRFDPRAPAVITDLDLDAIRAMAAER